jgi:hypothetical protein
MAIPQVISGPLGVQHMKPCNSSPDVVLHAAYLNDDFVQYRLQDLILNSHLPSLTIFVMFVLRLLILCLFFCIALAQSRSASFAYPPTPGGSTPLLTINVIDTIVVEWTSNFQPAYLWLFCDVPTTDSPTIVKCRPCLFPLRSLY